MEELQYVAQRLNAEPFNLTIRAVELEQKPPNELLQLLIDAVSLLEEDPKANVNVSTEPNDVILDKLIHFLTIHKCKILPTNDEELKEWTESIKNGQSENISLLYWLLSNYEHLKKRCYLSNYLMPINVPQEYLESDPNLAELLETYQDLQKEFISTHKEYSLVSASTISATELSDGRKQMGTEKKQLKEKLQYEQTQIRGNDDFELLLDETSKLRYQMDEEIRLIDQQNEQQQHLSAAKKRLEQVSSTDNALKNIGNDPSSVDELLQKLVFDHETRIAQKRHELELLTQSTTQMRTSRQGIEDIEAVAIELEEKLERKLVEFDEASQQSFSLEKLRSFQQVSLLYPFATYHRHCELSQTN